MKAIFDVLKWILLIGCVIGLLFVIQTKFDNDLKYQEYESRIKYLEDSIKRVIIRHDSVTCNLYSQIDSLEELRNDIIVVYEEIEKDFIDWNTISDDSVCIYISKKIHN